MVFPVSKEGHIVVDQVITVRIIKILTPDSGVPSIWEVEASSPEHKTQIAADVILQEAVSSVIRRMKIG